MKKIVAVDDEETIRRLVKIALDSQGYHCEIAADGEAGLNKIREIRPDLILLDVMMMKMNGFEVAAAVRRDPEIAHTKIIMLSARDKELGSLSGDEEALPPVDDYLMKPFDLRDLIATVKKHLE
jgi:DNA-binding response OmpR family regulator